MLQSKVLTTNKKVVEGSSFSVGSPSLDPPGLQAPSKPNELSAETIVRKYGEPGTAPRKQAVSRLAGRSELEKRSLSFCRGATPILPKPDKGASAPSR